MIALTPKRTKLVLRIRRALTATHPKREGWPVEAVDEAVTKQMKGIEKLSIKKVREAARQLGA